MAKHLTINRGSNRDGIYLPIHIFNPPMPGLVTISAQLDTGNDHTCIRQDVLKHLKVIFGERKISVNGVTGGALGSVAVVTFGLELDDGRRVTIDNHEVVVLEEMSCKALLGRDMLDFFDVTIRRGGTTILSFD